MKNNIQSKTWWFALTLLLLLAFGLRVTALNTVPPGLTHDEASNGHDSAAILRGVHRLYFPVGYGHEPLYNYTVAALTLLLGQRIFTLRLTTVLWSTLTWVLTVALCRRWWGRRAALFAGAALAVGFWPLMMARVGLRGPALPALLAASALSYHRAFTRATASPPRRRVWRGYVFAGLWLGLSFYTYMASRGMPLLYLTFLAALALFDRRALRQTWAGTLAVVLIAGVVGLPLFAHLRANPELEQRIAQLGSALVALRAGDPAPLWANVTASLPMLLWRADPRWLYNVAGRAALEPFLALAWIAGTVAALARLRDRRNVFVLLWLAGGLAPALLTTVEYNTLHAIAAMPAVFLLIALGLERAYTGLRASRWVLFVFALGLLATGLDAAHAYFFTWARHRDVRVAYHHHVVALGRHLKAEVEGGPVAITSLYPGEFHDPYTMEVTLNGAIDALRWSDGRGALFFPAGAARLYVEPQSAPHPALQPLVEGFARPGDTLRFRAGDLPPAILGYRWDAAAAWDALRAALMTSAFVPPGDAPPGPYHRKLPCPIVYDGTVALVGYRVSEPVLAPGGTVEVLTAWAVLAPYSEELVLFTHLLDGEGAIVRQADRLDAPSWQWRAGDRFAQVHTLALPEDLAAGTYGLAVGFYRRADLVRLPVDVEPRNVTRVLLPLDVVPPQ